jgi:N-carbamoylputrescine amidase
MVDIVDFDVLSAAEVPPSPARTRAPRRRPVTVGVVQLAWSADTARHLRSIRDGVRLAASHGADLVCLPELTLSPYFAADPNGPRPGVEPEPLAGGPTLSLAGELAAEFGVYVHASLWEADPAVAPRGWNTAICVSPAGEVVARTRKLHIPITAGYYEDRYFVPGNTGYPVVPLELGEARTAAAVGFPTCWDQWFPELARAYSLGGAELLVYPTAIGSEPDHPDFDTMPLWRQVIVANGITGGLFMAVPNRIGTEDFGGQPITFYGSSFISDPYGRVLVQATRHRPTVLVAALDLDQCRDWLDLFPFDTTRRPDTYGSLVDGDSP